MPRESINDVPFILHDWVRLVLFMVIFYSPFWLDIFIPF